MENDPNVNLETENQDGAQEPEVPVEGAANPYEEQLKQLEAQKAALEAELDSRKKQLELKDKALKKKQESVDPEAEDRILNRVEEILAKRERDGLISSLTQDEAAQKLVKHHLENTIKPSGDVKKDVETAWFLANQGSVKELLEKRASLEAFEDVVTGTQMGNVFGSNSQKPSTSPARRVAEEILRHANPDAIKNLDIK